MSNPRSLRTRRRCTEWRLAWESPIRRPIDRQSALVIAVNDLHHPASDRRGVVVLGKSVRGGRHRMHSGVTGTSELMADDDDLM